MGCTVKVYLLQPQAGETHLLVETDHRDFESLQDAVVAGAQPLRGWRLDGAGCGGGEGGARPSRRSPIVVMPSMIGAIEAVGPAAAEACRPPAATRRDVLSGLVGGIVAGSAATLPAAAASAADARPPAPAAGPDDPVPRVPSMADLSARRWPDGSAPRAVEVQGYLAPGDGGAGILRRAPEQAHGAGRVQSADGTWWQLAPPVDLAQLGAVGDGLADDSRAIQDAIDLHPPGRSAVISVPPGTYRIESPLDAGGRPLIWVFEGDVRLAGEHGVLPGQQMNGSLGHYGLNGRGGRGTALAVQDYYNPGQVLVEPGKQVNVLRFEGEFRGGDEAKAIAMELDFVDTVDGYCVIGAARNGGSGNTKALYGRAVAEETCTGVVVGVVAAAEVHERAAPETAFSLQVNVDGTGTPTRTWNAIHVGTNEEARDVTHGVVAQEEVSFSNAFLKGFNAGSGACLKWQKVGGLIIFEVDRRGAITQRDEGGNTLLTTAGGAGLDLGSPSAPDKGLGLHSARRRFTLRPDSAGDHVAIRDEGQGRDLLACAGGSDPNPVWLRVGDSLRQVVPGPPDSAGPGFRALRVRN